MRTYVNGYACVCIYICRYMKTLKERELKRARESERERDRAKESEREREKCV